MILAKLRFSGGTALGSSDTPGDFAYQQPSADWECTTGNPPPAPSLNLSRAGVTWPERFKAASHQ